MKRIYNFLLKKHLNNYRQMAFLTGPRQVGKTFTCLNFKKKIHYFNWDNQNHRIIILGGPESVAKTLKLELIRKNPIIIVFDEIHKYSKWKNFIKGFFDTYQNYVRIIVTGSSRLDIFKKTGDSLMGRYFLYRMHPLTIREVIKQDTILKKEIRSPLKINPNTFSALLKFGGFPEPFLKNDPFFYNKWKSLREQQFFKEDLRDLTRIQEVNQIQTLAFLIKTQAGGLVNFSNLASNINVSVDTVRRWISVLESLYYCFVIRPWFKNVKRSLLKEPKIYLWDWALVDEENFRKENFVASHLLKFIHFLNDQGHGNYGLYFLRNKDKKEVDFIIVKNNTPWIMIEVKASKNRALSQNLFYFQKQLKVKYAFQAVFDMPFINKNCFLYKKPVIVPVQTLLSQLI